MSEAIGVRGSVYLRIPEGGIGQVQIELGGALKTYNAKSEDGQGIATGDFIEVVDTITSTLVVKRV
jgi:membrane-bound ClpP family serine protease